jgi:arylsulfatase
MATALEVTATQFLNEIDGVQQMPIDGKSLLYSFDNAAAPSARTEQYYEQLGNRAMYKDGWKAVTIHGNRMPWVVAGTFPFDKDVWELYNLNEDFSETNNLAASNPQKLEELEKEWDEQAWKNNVYPLYDDIATRIAKAVQPRLWRSEDVHVLLAGRSANSRSRFRSDQEHLAYHRNHA